MPKLTIRDEFNADVKTITLPVGKTFADASMERFPEGFPGHSVFVYDAQNVPLSAETACTVPMGPDDAYTIVLRPQGGAIVAGLAALAGGGTILGLSATTFFSIALTAVTLIGNYLLRPKLPDVQPQYQWDSDDGPQFFSGQSNQLRPGSRVPDVFGTVRRWPELIVEPWLYYEGASQRLEELYVVSHGTCEVSDVRLHDETIDDLPNSSFEVIIAGNNWPTDFPIWRTNDYVGGIELPASNESIETGVTFSAVFGATTGTITASRDGFFNGFVPGQFFRIYGLDDAGLGGSDQFYEVVSVQGANNETVEVQPSPGTWNDIPNLTFRFASAVSVDGGGAPINYVTGGWNELYNNPQQHTRSSWYTTNSFAQPVDQNGNPMNDGSLVNTANTPPDEEASISFGIATGYDDGGGLGQPVTAVNVFMKGRSEVGPDSTGVFVRWAGNYDPNIPGTGFSTIALRVPGTTTGFAFDVEFPGGLYEQDSGQPPVQRSVRIRAYQRKVGEASWGEIGWANIPEFTAKTRTPRRFTVEIDWTTLGRTAGEYEVYFERETLHEENTATRVVQDACQLIGLRGKQDITGTSLETDTLNYTLLRLRLSSTNLPQVLRERALNCVAHRVLPDWANNDPGTWNRTNKMRDAMLWTLYREAPQIVLTQDALDDLNAIQAELDAIDTAAGEFNGIIDQTLSPEDQIEMIANVGRIKVYRRGDAIGFTRIKAGVTPRTLINSRNKVEPEQKVMNFSEQGEPDAVIVRYLDITNQYKETTVQYPAGITPTYPQEISVIGVTDPVQAYRTAKYLWDKRINERDTLDVSVTEDASMLVPGNVIAVTDHLATERPFDGEVLAINTDGATTTTFVLDRIIPAGTYIARLRDSMGELYGQHQYVVNKDRDVVEMFGTSWDGATLPTSPTSQVSLLYSFTPVETADYDLWQVEEISPSRDGPTKLSLMSYRDETYDADTVTALPPGGAAAQKPVRDWPDGD